MKKLKFTKVALIFSVCLMLVWSMLGTGATVAWFTDTPDADRNSFLIGQMDLDVSYKNDVVTQYTPMDSQSAVFNDKALYEPGYTQVVYLKISNNDNIDFNYKLSVGEIFSQDTLSVYGTTIHLPDYLRFGVIFGATEADLDRALAREHATEDMQSYYLNTYSKVDSVVVKPGQTRYAAIVVFMPEEVGNAANYKDNAPKVNMGLTVYAQQAGTPIA